MDDITCFQSNKTVKRGKKRMRSSQKARSGDGNFLMSDRGGEYRTKTTKKTGKDDTSNVKVGFGDYPYPTDYNDHFETPSRAYDDIFPLLEHILAKKPEKGNKKKISIERLQKKPRKSAETIIFDPYYCTGRAATLLNGVFERHKSNKISSTIRVQHDKRDFYDDIRNNSIPDYDILITNPPYSGNHKARCLEFSVDQLKTHERPFFLLMPNYVATKDYFRKIVSGLKMVQTFYVMPSFDHPYEYDHPEGTGHQTSPFASVWFCGLNYADRKAYRKSVIDAFIKFHSSHCSSVTGTPRIVTSLRELIHVGGVSGERRKNPRQRRKMRRQAMERADNVYLRGGITGNAVGDQGGRLMVSKKTYSGLDDLKSGKERRDHGKKRKLK